MAPGSPHLPVGSARSCTLSRYTQHFRRERKTQACVVMIHQFSSSMHNKKLENQTVAMKKENNPFQLVGLAFAVISTSGRAVVTVLSLGYAAEIHHAKSHLVP